MVFAGADHVGALGQTSGLPPLAEKIAEEAFITCPPPIWFVISIDKEAAPIASAGTVTERVTRRMLSAGTVTEPLEGETPSVNGPPAAATQFRLAGTPLARTVISMGCVDPGANVALETSAVTEGAGIHPVAASTRTEAPSVDTDTEINASESARCGGRARMFLWRKKRGPVAIPGPRLRSISDLGTT